MHNVMISIQNKVSNGNMYVELTQNILNKISIQNKVSIGNMYVELTRKTLNK